MDNINPPSPPLSPSPAGPSSTPSNVTSIRPGYPTPEIDDRHPHVSPPRKHETIREIFSTIGVLVAALVVAFALIAWVFQSYEVDGQSMETTLQNNDRLIVWKVPRTISRITGNPYIPHRGDIVIFSEGGLAQYGNVNSKQLIKRVIALPGERLVFHNGDITVYNDDHPEGFNPDKTMSYGKLVNHDPDLQDIDITLGKNQIFVCGDNRPNSLDSRSFGPIQADQIVGKLALRLLPVSGLKKF